MSQFAHCALVTLELNEQHLKTDLWLLKAKSIREEEVWSLYTAKPENIDAQLSVQRISNVPKIISVDVS